jgi:hypothetical protein
MEQRFEEWIRTALETPNGKGILSGTTLRSSLQANSALSVSSAVNSEFFGMVSETDQANSFA